MRGTLLLIVLLAACGGDDASPSALVISALPEELDPSDDGDDDLTIVVEYYDGDADLGGGTAAVHDCRADDVITLLEIPPIASEEAIAEGVPIEGTLELVVADVGEIELDNSAPDVCAELGVEDPIDGEAVFCVILQDAAGNDGPGDCTGAIAIVAP